MENRGIGMCFQDNALVPHWEARRNIGFFLRLRKREYEVPERMRRISQITGIGLEKLMDRLPRQLSGGEQQRVSIARALARDPRVFLFDEPFSNLDAPLRTQARIELKKLLHEFPVTSVYVTHDQHEAIALADRIAVMRAGKIEQVGTYQQLHDNPRNLFVATFLGSPPINLFTGLVRDHHWVGRSFGGYPIRADLADDVQVLMGVRPADMHIASDGVPGKVETVIPFYSERYQLLEIEAEGERWQVIAPLDQPMAVGDTVHFGLNVDSVMYFDAQTHERIG
jgi:multiple sugar transport system ATP-binding protein